jgi:hypothetical protein
VQIAKNEDPHFLESPKEPLSIDEAIGNAQNEARCAGSLVKQNRGNVSELRDSSKFLANVNKSRDLQANSAPPFVTKQDN